MLATSYPRRVMRVRMVSKYNIKVQYAAWMAAVTLATVVVMTAAHLRRELDEQQQMIRHRGEIAAQTLAKTVVAGVLSNSFPAMAQGAELLNSDRDIVLSAFWIRVARKSFPNTIRPGPNRYH